MHFVVRRDVAASATVLCALCGEAVEGAPCVCDAGLVHMGCTVGEISAARRRMVAEKEATQVADAAEELRAWRAHELRGRRRDHHRRWEATRARKRRHPPKTSTKPVLVVTTTAMRGCGEGRKRIPGKAKQKTAEQERAEQYARWMELQQPSRKKRSERSGRRAAAKRRRLSLYLRRSAYAAFDTLASAMVALADQAWALRGGAVAAAASASSCEDPPMERGARDHEFEPAYEADKSDFRSGWVQPREEELLLLTAADGDQVPAEAQPLVGTRFIPLETCGMALALCTLYLVTRASLGGFTQETHDDGQRGWWGLAWRRHQTEAVGAKSISSARASGGSSWCHISSGKGKRSVLLCKGPRGA